MLPHGGRVCLFDALVHEINLLRLGPLLQGRVLCCPIVLYCLLVRVKLLLLNQFRLFVRRGTSTLVQRNVEVVLQLYVFLTCFLLRFLCKQFQDVVLSMCIQVLVLFYDLIDEFLLLIRSISLLLLSSLQVLAGLLLKSAIAFALVTLLEKVIDHLLLPIFVRFLAGVGYLMRPAARLLLWQLDFLEVGDQVFDARARVLRRQNAILCHL